MFINKIEPCLSAFISMPGELNYVQYYGDGKCLITEFKSVGNHYVININMKTAHDETVCVKKEDYVGIVLSNKITLYFKTFPTISLSIDRSSEKGKKVWDFIQKEFIEHSENEIDLLNSQSLLPPNNSLL